MKKSYIGIDISKLNFSAAIKINNKEQTKSFPNHENGFKQFLEWLQKNLGVCSYHACMESTGKYGINLATFLVHNGHTVSIINPAKIKHFMKSKLVRNKTDETDAKLILEYGELFNPSIWHPTPIKTRALQELIKRLNVLIEMSAQEKNRLVNADEIIKELIINHIDFLKKEIKQIQVQIKNHITSNESLKEQAVVVNSIIGIGEKTANQIIAFLGDLRLFTKAKHMVSFVGLNPHRFQSGTSLNNSRLSKIGNADLRKMFYMPALVAIKYNPIIKAFYEKLIAKGKPKKVAICAAMRKLVHIVYGVLKTKKVFDPTMI